MAKPQVFMRTPGKVSGFVIIYKLYLQIKMRGVAVKEQIQWILSYIQGRLADVWKENTLEYLEGDLLEYEIVGEFLVDIRKEFGGGDKKKVKAVELKRLEQKGRIMKDFVQEFRRIARGNEYERRPLVKEFKREINWVNIRELNRELCTRLFILYIINYHDS